MWNQNKKLKNIDMVPMILGILTVLMGYFAWGLWTISYKASVYKDLSFLFSLITMCLYIGMSVLLSKWSTKRELSEQIFNISVIGAVLFFILLMTNMKFQVMQNEYYAILINTFYAINSL